jgi:hypothetical protein
LLANRAVEATPRGPATAWSVELGPCDGGVYLVTPRPINQLQIASSDSVPRGQPLEVTITIADSTGEPVPAVIPVRVDILDPNGRPAEYSGHYGAPDGVLKLRLDTAVNDTPGVWQIRSRELASGRTATRFVRVQP